MAVELLGELAGGVFRAVARIAGEVILNVILEVAIRGAGYLICKPFKSDVDPDGWLATSVGVTFWVTVAVLAYFAWNRIGP